MWKNVIVLITSLTIMILWGFVIAFIVQLCWNGVMPHIFQLPTINYLQAFGLYLLFGMLLKSNINVNQKD